VSLVLANLHKEIEVEETGQKQKKTPPNKANIIKGEKCSPR
jgi:hypothetical protein